MAGTPRDENARLDAAAHVWMLTEMGFMTLGEAAETTGLKRNTVARVRDGESCRIDVSGLTAAVIRELYQTASGVALRCQMAEHGLRMASLDLNAASVALGLIPAAEALAASLPAAKARLEDVDLLALSSLKAQLALYKARYVDVASEKEAQLRAAFSILDGQSAAVIRLVIYGDQTCDADKLLGLRMMLNLFFAAWELDEIAGERARLPLAREIAAPLCEGDFLARGRAIAKMIRDPRLSYQLAEAAAVTGQFWASARLLADSMRLTGHDPACPRSWAPLWLTVSITNEPHFEEPIAILERSKNLN